MLLALACLAVALVSPVWAVALAIVGVAVIWLRGYLVPYTPRFAPALTARLPWNPFHAQRSSDSLADVGSSDGEAVLEALIEREFVQVQGDDLQLAPAFETAWYEEMTTLAAMDPETVAAETAAVAPAAVDATVHTTPEHTYVILSDGSSSVAGEAWLRHPVAIVETAAARVLADAGVETERRIAAAHAMGLFLQTCPVCGGTVVEGPATECCGPPETGPNGEPLQARVCEACDVRFHVFE